MTLTILELLKEFGLCLVIEIGVLYMFYIFDPNSWILDFALGLDCLADALANCKWGVNCNFSEMLLFFQWTGCVVHSVLWLWATRNVLAIAFADNIRFYFGGSSLYLEWVLNSYNLVNSVSKPSKFLALVMKLVLIHIILDEGVKLKLPPFVLFLERLYDFDLFLSPFSLDFSFQNCVGIAVYWVSLSCLFFIVKVV